MNKDKVWEGGWRKFRCDPRQIEVSNLDQLFLPDGAIMMLETSTSSLSFRSSELSQPI